MKSVSLFFLNLGLDNARQPKESHNSIHHICERVCRRTAKKKRELFRPIVYCIQNRSIAWMNEWVSEWVSMWADTLQIYIPIQIHFSIAVTAVDSIWLNRFVALVLVGLSFCTMISIFFCCCWCLFRTVNYLSQTKLILTMKVRLAHDSILPAQLSEIFILT